MVKVHTFTDREYRYSNRCNNKLQRELSSTIIKSGHEYLNLFNLYKYYTIKNQKLNNSYDFLYNQYSHLFETNRSNVDLISEFQNKYVNKNNELILLTQKYNDLNEKYNQLIDEFVEDNLENENKNENENEN